MKLNRILAIVVMVFAMVALVFGVVFIAEGIAKYKLIRDRMEVERVTLPLDPDNPSVMTQVNDAADAQRAADIIASHRRAIAPTYQDLLSQGNGRFDPSNPAHLTYAQAMNLENYLYLAVAAFGLVQVALAAGVFMVVTALALGAVGTVLLRISPA
ncbi:MAG: hypothetical protein N2506_05830 [Dehalococcoidales bacterium]|nr:hypothetical protein [Dehalococcoidales bacterium]